MPSATAMLDMLPGLVAYFDRNLTYRYANATYASWRGIAPDQIVGRHCRDIVGELNFPTVLPRLIDALGGTPVRYEYALFDGGNARRVQGSYVPDFDSDGSVRGIVVLVTDISVRSDLEARIAENEIMFNDAFEHAPVGMAVTNADGRMERVNSAFAAMLGRTIEDVAGLDFRTITHPDDQNADALLFGEIVAGYRDEYTLEKRYLHPSGEPVHASLAVSAVRAPDGSLIRMIAHIQDVTERRRADHALQEINARLTLAMEAVRGGFWHIDVETRRFETSTSFSRFVRGPEGTGPIDLDTYGECIAPANRDAASVQTLLDGEIDNASVEYELSTVNGPRWMRCDRKLLRAPDGSPFRIVGVTIDISEDRERQLRAVVDAETDPLTGLLNRRGLDQRLEQTTPGVSVGIIAIDLDRFKAINDRFGHSVGDAVLVEVARRLRGAVRASDHLARLGGDEFAVLLPEADDARLSVVADRIERALCEQMTNDDVTLPISGSVGAVLMDGRPRYRQSRALRRRYDAPIQRCMPRSEVVARDRPDLNYQRWSIGLHSLKPYPPNVSPVPGRRGAFALEPSDTGGIGLGLASVRAVARAWRRRDDRSPRRRRSARPYHAARLTPDAVRSVSSTAGRTRRARPFVRGRDARPTLSNVDI